MDLLALADASAAGGGSRDQLTAAVMFDSRNLNQALVPHSRNTNHAAIEIHSSAGTGAGNLIAVFCGSSAAACSTAVLLPGRLARGGRSEGETPWWQAR